MNLSYIIGGKNGNDIDIHENLFLLLIALVLGSSKIFANGL